MPKEKKTEPRVKKPITIKNSFLNVKPAEEVSQVAQEVCPVPPEESVAPEPAPEPPTPPPPVVIATESEPIPPSDYTEVAVEPHPSETALKAQREEIDRLRKENETLNSRLGAALTAPRNEIHVSPECHKCDRVKAAAKELEDELLQSCLSETVMDLLNDELGQDVEDDEDITADDKVLVLFQLLRDERRRNKLLKTKMNNLIAETQEMREENDTLLAAVARLEKQLADAY